MLDGTFGKLTPMTLAEFIDQIYWPWAEANYNTPRLSHLSHTVNVKKALGHMPLTDIQPLHIERFKRERLSTKTKRGGDRKPATVNRDLQQLGSMLEMARKNGLIEKNPVREVRLLRQDNQRTRYLTDEEEQSVMTLLNTYYVGHKPIIAFALNTGMRRGEIVSLDWQDVDFSRGVINVKKTKTAKTRSVPMNSTVVHLLTSLTPQQSGKVFAKAAQSVSYAWRWITKRLRLSDITFHDLRHTFATRLLDVGVDPFTIAEVLGHSDIQMTKRYAHSLESNKRRAVEALENRNNVVEMSQIRHKEDEKMQKSG